VEFTVRVLLHYVAFSVLNYKTVFLQLLPHFEFVCMPLFLSRMSVVGSFIISYYYGSTALCWAFAAFFFQFLDPIHSQYDSLDGESAHRKAANYTRNNTNRINAHNTDIHALNSIRIHDPSVRASEESSCIRPRGHSDRHYFIYIV
jgi:hypothetical protein